MRSDRHARSDADARPQPTRRLPSAPRSGPATGRDGAPDRLVGRVLDRRYRLLARIARGGMASVYEAHDERLDRIVAVKVMHAGLGDDAEFAARFVREARAAAGLSHPNVVAVYDQGEDDGTVYLAMELVPGHTLRDTIAREAPLGPARALALLQPVLSALAAAHRKGLVHRDVKPENVLIHTDDGGGPVVKVADFGLAKAVSADTQHTTTGALIGTVSYVAPELVVEGRSDARADVYAAGVILYELLTGHKPHEGETPIQVAYKHVHEDVPAPSAEVPGIPPYVDALVARATARDRGLRFADAGVMLHQVRRVASALADRLPDDPELTTDLALPTTALPRPADLSDEHSHDLSHDTGHDTGELATAPVALLSPPTPPSGPGVSERRPVRPARPPRRRRGPLLLVLALLLAAGIGGGAWWFGWERYTTTPGVLGIDRASAVQRLEEAGLTPQVGEAAYSDTVAKGLVISTDPEPGGRVLDGGEVTLVLSKGPEVYRLPDLSGGSVDAAQDALAEIELTYGQAREVWSETVPAGTVIRSAPKAGTVLRPGAVVDVVVSKGRRPIKVGDWVGRPADRAERVLSDRGLVVERTTEHHDTVPAGRVISQSPRGGTLHKGDTVELVVSEGPELVEIPSGLMASGVEHATEVLEAAGFRVRTEEGPTYVGLGFVIRVEPGSGTMAPKGSVVTLVLT